MIYDGIFVGAGLSNSLLVYRLHQLRPHDKFLLLEEGEKVGGSHTWSFHQTDIPKESWDWLLPLVTRTWKRQEVRFPSYSRVLELPYHSVRSDRFAAKVESELGDIVRLRSRVSSLSRHSVTLENGQEFFSHLVVDGRGLPETQRGALAFQKFGGLHVELEHPHGLAGPVIMDATVDQEEGYRFFYLLPWGPLEVLVEDTRYTGDGEMDRDEMRENIRGYLAKKGWAVRQVIQEEWGMLPIPLVEKFIEPHLSPWQWVERSRAAAVGVRAGFFHPTTSYSFPDAVRVVEAITRLKRWETEDFLKALYDLHQEKRKQDPFFRLLNRFLILGAAPRERYKILERFYQLPQSTIERFYSCELDWRDRIRILVGRPPLDLGAAIGALSEKAVAYA